MGLFQSLPLFLVLAVQDSPQTDPGLTLRVYRVDGDLQRIPELVEDQTPNVDRVIETLELGQDDFGGVPASFVTHVRGFLEVRVAGSYVFQLTSDDGARAWLGDERVVDHDGTHGATAMESGVVELTEGRRVLFVEHFDHGGQRSLQLRWKRPGSSVFETIPAELLSTERDLTRVTSPGVKRIKSVGRPGDLLPLDGVHPSWRVETIRPEGFEPKVGAMAFLPDGRLAFGTFDPLQRDDRSLPDIESKKPDTIYALDVTTRELVEIATNVYEPSGMCVVDGELYVAHRRAVSKLTDGDGDGFLETHTTIAEGWEAWNYHQFVFGLVHKDGKLYTALSTSMAPPGWEGMKTNAGPNGPMRGSFLEIDLATGDTHAIAGGARTPNGLGLGSNGELLYADNQGAWMPASVLCEVQPGRFYGHYNWTNPVTKLADRFPEGGHPSVYCDRPRTPPALWLPQNEAINSPTEILHIPGDLPLPAGRFRGQYLIGELTGGGIRRASLQRIDGVLQGALFRFSQGFECGINRMRFGPDGSIYVGGIGAGGNWKWRDTQFGLQRLVPTGERVREIYDVKIDSVGFLICFEDALPSRAANADNYRVTSWTYEPTGEYGGPKVDVRTHKTSSNVSIQSPAPAHRLPDGSMRSTSGLLEGIVLRIEGFEPGRVYHVRLLEDDESPEPRLWSTEFWYTVNRIPSERGQYVKHTRGVGALPIEDAVTLVASARPMAMRFANDSTTNATLTQDELLAANPYASVGFGSGDLESTTQFGDARLHIEWFSPPGGEGQQAGNSGVYLQGRYEVQVLGSAPAPHEPRDNEAGGIYSIKAPDVNASKGPGQWQAYDLWFTAPRFRDGEKIANARLTAYLNGIMIHKDVEIPHPTGAAKPGGEEAGPDGEMQIGPLRFQDHSSDAEGPVRYRNVWIAPLESSERKPGEWIDLLDAGTWEPRGGAATFERADGVLRGTTVPNTPNTFWTSKNTYGDFEMTWEAKVHPELNSGVQIRSLVLGGFDQRDGALQGYQVEFDPSDRSYSAGIYDERRRGWLHTLESAPYARRAFRPNEWNRFRVVCEGPVIRTWINGIPAAEIHDAMTLEGHIGFQVHGVGERADPLQVEWRNVRLRELR